MALKQAANAKNEQEKEEAFGQ